MRCVCNGVMGTFIASTDPKGDRIMCFSDPGKVCSIDATTARVMTDDGLQDVSLRLMEAAGARVEVGDWVLVSLGLVVSVLDAADAEILFDEMSALRGGAD